MTDTLGGSPIGRSISGRNTPEFPTSTHFFRPEREGGGERGGERGREGIRSKGAYYDRKQTLLKH